MAAFRFRLKRQERRSRRDLLYFLDALALHLMSGFDLGYSWPEVLEALAGDLTPSLVARLHFSSPTGITQHLRSLAQDYPNPGHRLWFSVLAELYGHGAPLGEAVQAVARTLRQELERDLEHHCRTLPVKANACLLLFFLPPTLILLFFPLLLELQSAF